MSTSTAGSSTSPSPSDVGLTFVEMMFAVAVGDTASQVAKVMQQLNLSRSPPLEKVLPIGDALWEVSPSIAHLSLVLLVIATSWVGWYHSSSTKRYMAALHDIFPPRQLWPISFPFFMLLIDVFLVVCYFILSEGAELPTYDAAMSTFVIAPSVGSEVFWIMVITGSYFVWNVAIALHGRVVDGNRLFENQRGWRMFSAVAAFAIPCFAYCTKWTVQSVGAVLSVDAALLLAVLAFRVRWVDDLSKILWWDVLRGILLLFAAVYFVCIA